MDYEQKTYDLEYENKKLKIKNEELEEEMNYLVDHKDNLIVLNKIMTKVSKESVSPENYKEHYEDFWIPILKKQYFKYMITNDKKAIVELEDNVWKNWNLAKEEKRKILKEIRGKNGR